LIASPAQQDYDAEVSRMQAKVFDDHSSVGGVDLPVMTVTAWF